jgi:hypothetical protein
MEKKLNSIINFSVSLVREFNHILHNNLFSTTIKYRSTLNTYISNCVMQHHPCYEDSVHIQVFAS